MLRCVTQPTLTTAVSRRWRVFFLQLGFLVRLLGLSDFFGFGTVHLGVFELE